MERYAPELASEYGSGTLPWWTVIVIFAIAALLQIAKDSR